MWTQLLWVVTRHSLFIKSRSVSQATLIAELILTELESEVFMMINVTAHSIVSDIQSSLSVGTVCYPTSSQAFLHNLHLRKSVVITLPNQESVPFIYQNHAQLLCKITKWIIHYIIMYGIEIIKSCSSLPCPRVGSPVLQLV